MTNDKILIGEIKGAHGVKGLVRLAVYADNTDLFKTLKNPSIILKNKHKNEIWLAAVEGITDKDAADAMKGTKLYCDRSALPEPDADEIYLADLNGMECVDEDGNLIGTVIDVVNFGAGDLLDIKPPKGDSFYLSYDDNTVLDIGKKITVSLPQVI